MSSNALPAELAAPDPPYKYEPYLSTRLRAPTMPLRPLPFGLAEKYGPAFGPSSAGPADNDLTQGQGGEPLGERIIVTGRLVDQARARAPSPVDRNLASQRRRSLPAPNGPPPCPSRPSFRWRRPLPDRRPTDATGSSRSSRGAYPWQNHDKAFRPAHIHFSVFGTSFIERLVTQMYFPGDPLLDLDPIFQSIGDRKAAEMLVSKLDKASTAHNWALGYKLRHSGRGACRHAS